MTYAGSGTVYAVGDIPALASNRPDYVNDHTFQALKVDLNAKTISTIAIPASNGYATGVQNMAIRSCSAFRRRRGRALQLQPDHRHGEYQASGDDPGRSDHHLRVLSTLQSIQIGPAALLMRHAPAYASRVLFVRLALAATLAFGATRSATAQRWDAAQARALAERATSRRAAQVADTTLAGYRAKARGTLEFLGQFGDTALFPPKIVRSSELAVDVFWSAPNVSRQVVVGMRDTSLVPMDIGFYRDRYGIVQSNFPDRIRLGDGQDVADVLHPLSVAGLAAYQFALGDSLSIAVGTSRIGVQEILFRPRDPTAPRAVGRAYVDRRTGDIVRLSLTFTRAALLDDRIEALSVTLENALVDGRYWLPRTQELEVQRGGTLFDFPARGIVRGRWSICCYDIDPRVAALARAMPGPELTFRPAPETRVYKFDDSLFTDLHGASTVSSADVARVQEEARRSMSRRALERPPGVAFAAGSVSDLARFDRAEGVAFGAGTTLRLGGGWNAGGIGRFGLDDRRAKAMLFTDLPLLLEHHVRIFAERAYRDVSDEPEASGVRNSLSAQEFGHDNTDLFDVRGAGVELPLGRGGLLGGFAPLTVGSFRWRLIGEIERQRSLSVVARPVRGSFAPLVRADAVGGAHLSLVGDGARWQLTDVATVSANGELRLGQFSPDRPGALTTRFARLHLHGEFQLVSGKSTVRAETFASGVAFGGPALPQQLVYFGGPISGPGYTFDQFAGRAGLSQHVEWGRHVSFGSLPMNQAGSVPAVTQLALYAHAGWIEGATNHHEVFPAIGGAAELFSGLLRADVARGLRHGRWTFGIDAGRAFWSIF